MQGPTRANAFSDAKTQAAVLEQWKLKSAQRKETASSLRQKVKQLKCDAENGRRAAQWLQERDALNREQDACEAALDALEGSLDRGTASGSDAHLPQPSLQLAALKVVLREQLAAVGALRGKTPAAPLMATRVGSTEAVHRVAELREWVAAELAKCDADADALTASAPMPAPVHDAFAECRVTAAQVQQALDELCSAFQPPQQLRDTFAVAVKAATEEAATRIAAASSGGEPTTTAPEVLRTVGLIVRMGQQARQFDLSASTTSALVERVSAVYPELGSAEAHTAVAEAVAQRTVRTLAQAVLADLQRTHAALLSSCESAFLVAQQAEAERQERADKARQRAAAQLERHAHLAEERAAHAVVLQRRQSEVERTQAVAAAKAQALQARRAEEFRHRLGLFEAYTAQQAALRQKERELAELQVQAEEEARAERLRRNGERVEHRRQRDEQRLREQRQREREVVALQAKKAEALERFFAAVDKQVGVEADPQRVLKATSSSAQTEHYVTLAQTTRPSLAGFTDEQIMKDPRVRLYHALLEAGLHTTPYGREVATRGYRVSPAQRSSEGNPLRGEYT